MIDEVSLANSFQTQLGLADSVLTGKVNVTSDNGMDIGNDYELKVTLQAANAFLGAGVTPRHGLHRNA